jgi:epoxyqueuosine reductase QueG
MPAGCLFASSAVPYTKLNKVSHDMLDAIGYSASLELEESGFRTVAVPADDPSEYWEAERQYARGIISLRHAGYLAGLGVLGRNTLLKNGRYGNMILLGAVLLDAPLEADPVDASDPCPPDCRICLDACPQEALDGETVIQQKCRPLSNHITVRGMQLYKCWECRKACPDALGKG